MGWFQLDPQSLAHRAQNTRILSLSQSIWLGVIGFTVVSVAGFVPWAVAGRWFYRNIGEAGLYAVCAVVFMGLNGLLLHKLVIGSGSLSRFYKLFTIAFAAYAVAWIVGWMALKGHPGSTVGLRSIVSLLAGTVAMGIIMAEAFEARNQLLVIIAALFILNTAGYFIGGWVKEWVEASDGLLGLTRRARITLANLLWGVFYGIGFGAGLGIAFYLCQNKARQLLGQERVR